MVITVELSKIGKVMLFLCIHTRSKALLSILLKGIKKGRFLNISDPHIPPD